MRLAAGIAACLLAAGCTSVYLVRVSPAPEGPAATAQRSVAEFLAASNFVEDPATLESIKRDRPETDAVWKEQTAIDTEGQLRAVVYHVDDTVVLYLEPFPPTDRVVMAKAEARGEALAAKAGTVLRAGKWQVRVNQERHVDLRSLR